MQINYYVSRIKHCIKKNILFVKYTGLCLAQSGKERIKKVLKGDKKISPKVLQLPITFKCNFDCVMCGMRNLIGNEDYSCQDLKKIISDPIYSSIKSVGINGGEPFLRNDLIEFIEILLTLPSLKTFYFISNGYLTDRILNTLPIIKKMCEERKVTLNIAFSVDGVGDMQDLMRGHRNAFEKVNHICCKILEDKEKYCDDLTVISTITKINIARIYEVQEWAEQLGIEVAYNIATIHARIDNSGRFEDFSIFTDEEARHLAMEFFYTLFLKKRSQRYFAIYYFIRYQKRVAYCDYQRSALTLVPNGNLAYCATHSKEVGNVIQSGTSNVYYENLDYQKELIKTHCASCSHYMYNLNSEGLKEYYKELLRIY